MLTGVSSSFIDQLNSNIGRPQRQFTIGTSDYSDWVTKWPTLKRSVDISQLGTVNISLFNGDGKFNDFYLNTYSLPNTVAIKVGFDDEFATVFYGFIKKVDYSGDHCNLTFKDRLFDFTQKRVGASNYPVTYSLSTPSNIAWDLCTCYGGLSPIKDATSFSFIGSTYYWGATNATLTASATSARWSPTNSYGTFDLNYSLQGCLSPMMQITMQRAGGSGWWGRLFYNTGGHSASYSYFIDPTYATHPTSWNTTSYYTITYDMSSVAAVGSFYDWVTNIVSNWWIRFGQSSLDHFNIKHVVWTGSYNPDICFSSWVDWSSVFSADSLKVSARFADHKVQNALSELCNTTDSGIWVGRDGKLHFKRFTSADSVATLIQESEIKELEIDIDDTRVVNKAFVDFEWSQASNYFARTISTVNSDSAAAFGLKEESYQSGVVWWVNSTDALNLGNRKILQYKDLPAYLDLITGLKGFNRDMGESIRLTNSFYSINSATAWTIFNEEADLNTGFIKYNLRPIAEATGFRLDVDSLDGSKQLL